MISIVNDTDFQVDLGLYVVKFWATWCGPCKKMEPSLLQLENEFPTIKFLSVDVDQVPTLAQKFRIKTIPSLIIIRDGNEINRVTGMSLIDPLRKLFQGAIEDLGPVI